MLCGLACLVWHLLAVGDLGHLWSSLRYPVPEEYWEIYSQTQGKSSTCPCFSLPKGTGLPRTVQMCVHRSAGLTKVSTHRPWCHTPSLVSHTTPGVTHHSWCHTPPLCICDTLGVTHRPQCHTPPRVSLPLVSHITPRLTHHPWRHATSLVSHTTPGATLHAPGCPLQSYSFFHLGSLCARVQGHRGSLGAGAAGASFSSHSSPLLHSCLLLPHCWLPFASAYHAYSWQM